MAFFKMIISMKSMLLLLLCLPIVLGALSACGDHKNMMEETTAVKNNEQDTYPSTDSQASPEKKPKDGFHIKKLIVNSESFQSVNVTSGDTKTEVYAKKVLENYLGYMGIGQDEQGYPISIQLDSSIPEDGYRVQIHASNTEGMTIYGGNGRGVLYAVWRFLEEQAGVRFFTPSLELCDEKDILINTETYDFAPIFYLRQIDWYAVKLDPMWCVKNGINISAWYGKFPEYLGGSLDYSGLSVHTLAQLTDTPASEQPCLTDPQNLQKAIASVRSVLERNPDATLISVSQNDNASYCKCANCEAITKAEGSPSGTLLRFVNAVAEDIAEDYPNVTVDTLAYQWSQKAPSITKPRENVCVRLCSITCDFTHPLTDHRCNENKVFCDDLSAWSEICNNIYIWDYTVNYRYLIPTYANFHVLLENMRFYAEHNVKGVFPEGNYQSQSGEFGELRTYLLAKLLMDPMMSEETYNRHMNEFLQAYYGEGWTYIRSYIDAVCEKAATGCQSIYGHPFEAVTKDFYLSMEETFEEYWNRAEELAGNRLKFVQRSRLQWRYIRLMLHPNEKDAKALISDVNASSIVWTEGSDKQTVDYSKGPDEWYSFFWWQ